MRGVCLWLKPDDHRSSDVSTGRWAGRVRSVPVCAANLANAWASSSYARAVVFQVSRKGSVYLLAPLGDIDRPILQASEVNKLIIH